MAPQIKKWLDPGAVAEHGQYIFIYANRKNHIVYSLTRAVKNNAALKQLPFFGKGSVPSRIRKDEWRPLATVAFPSGYQGLAAYKQLREFRKRHELEWEDKDAYRIRKTHMKNTERGSVKFGKLHTRRFIARWYNTSQKANGIADLAFVLDHQVKIAQQDAAKDAKETAKHDAAVSKARARITEIIELKRQAKQENTAESRLTYKALKNEKIKLLAALNKPVPHAALNGEYDRANDNRTPARRGVLKDAGKLPRPSMSTEGVRIEWANVLDAQFASTWPSHVLHEQLPPSTHRSRNLLTTKLEPPLAQRRLMGEAEPSVPDIIKPLEPLEPEPQKPKEPENDPNIPEPHLKFSPRRIDRILHRLKHGAY